MPEFFKGLGAVRAGAMAGVAAALTGFFLYIFGIIAEPPMTILYSGLAPREASAVAQRLDAMDVTYEARGDGGTIVVPANAVTRLRMQLATEGLPAEGIGYEIFDDTDTFGTTSFVQTLNRLRALEGELARSIRALSTIDTARVHLVIPDRQIFSRDNQLPSASVVVSTRAQLSRGQVSAIQHLIAASVAGLTANAVAIVDDKGRLLAGGNSNDAETDMTAAQEERTTDAEARLRQRVESIVSSVVGPGKVRVQVAAEMDFNRITESQETFDPDGRVIRSSQTVEESSSDTNRDSTAAVSIASTLPGQAPTGEGEPDSVSANSRTEETINYEISKSTRTQVQEVGTVKKLAVAVVVDGTYTADADGARIYAPRNGEDMTKITELVRTAIGYDEERGDQLQVTNMQFAEIDMGPELEISEPPLGIDMAIWLKLGEVLILSITALLVGLLVVRPMIRRLTSPMGTNDSQRALPAPGGNGVPQPQEGGFATAQIAATPQNTPLSIPREESMIDIGQIQGQVRESSIRKVGEVVSSHPEEAMAILRTWLHQPA